MSRKRRAQSTRVDLVGFLDIVSTLVVIMLLVLSILALSMAGGNIAEVNDNSKAPPRIEVKTYGGTVLNESTSFFICDSKGISQYNPEDSSLVAEYSFNSASLQSDLLLNSVGARAYLAVKPSCFGEFDKVVKALRSNGNTVGYEPVVESTKYPWPSS